MSRLRALLYSLWRLSLRVVAHTALPTTAGWRRPLLFANPAGRALIAARERASRFGLMRPAFEMVRLDEPPVPGLAEDVRQCHAAAMKASTTALSDIWAESARRFAEGLSEEGLRTFRRTAVGDSGYMASGVRDDRRQGLEVVLAYHRFARASDPLLIDTVEETPAGGITAVRYRGKLISYNLMRHAMFAGRIQRYVDLAPALTIVEIGSGYGSLARLMTILSPRSRVVLVDIPSSLALAYYYLRRSCPSISIAAPHQYTSGRDAMASDATVVLLPDGWIDAVPSGSVDLVINTTSFQEMQPEVLRRYFEALQRFSRGYFYCYNRLRTPASYGGVAFADYPFDSNWQPVSQRMSPEGHYEWIGRRIAR